MLPRISNKTLAIDLYMSAQRANPPNRLREEALEGLRIGRHWEWLAGPSVLCLLMYSAAAESIVYVPLRLVKFVRLIPKAPDHLG